MQSEDGDSLGHIGSGDGCNSYWTAEVAAGKTVMQTELLET